MQLGDLSWKAHEGRRSTRQPPDDARLVLFFGSHALVSDPARYRELRATYARAHILGCSSGGQIRGDGICDDEIVGAAIAFSGTSLRLARATVASATESRRAGAKIGAELAADDLAGVFVLSDGLGVNGSQLVAGITGSVGAAIPVTGGLAGDADRFEETLVCADDAPAHGVIGAIGFYGPAIRFRHGSAGGWDKFGPRRVVTRSEGNVLHELDGEPALDLYERYLGAEDIAGLPGTALLYPLLIRDPDNHGREVVRTILAIDRANKSMTFAGDVPEGWTAQLMRGSFDRLAEGAARAARQASMRSAEPIDGDRIALLVSCIGRRLLMGEHTLDEVEAAGTGLAPVATRIGFYSYGEISPHKTTGMCELHNQTMTVTTLHEAAG